MAGLRLEGELNIYRAAELKVQLLEALAVNETLEIDLSGVTELDSSGVQLLMLAKRVAEAGQKQLRLAMHSPVVLDVFELFNLAAYFGDPLVIAASAAPAGAA